MVGMGTFLGAIQPIPFSPTFFAWVFCLPVLDWGVERGERNYPFTRKLTSHTFTPCKPDLPRCHPWEETSCVGCVGRGKQVSSLFLCLWSVRLPGAPCLELGQQTTGETNVTRVKESRTGCQWHIECRMGKMGVGIGGEEGMNLYWFNTCCVPGTVLVTFTSVTSSNLPCDLVR